MRSSLIEKIKRVQALPRSEDLEFFPEAYELHPYRRPEPDEMEVPDSYRQFLEIAPGGAGLGDVSLYGWGVLREEGRKHAAAHPERKDRFFHFGNWLGEALLMMRGTDIVFIERDDSVPPEEWGRLDEIAPFTEFLDQFVLGPRYVELAGTLEREDPWWNLLENLGFR